MSASPVPYHGARVGLLTPSAPRTHTPAAPEAKRRPWAPVAPPAPRRMDDPEVMHRAALAHVEVLRLAVGYLERDAGSPEAEPFAEVVGPIREYIAAWAAREAAPTRAARWCASIDLGRVAGELDRAVTVTGAESLLDGIARELGCPPWCALLDAAARADLAREVGR